MAASDGSGSPSRPSTSTTSVERREKIDCAGWEKLGIIVPGQLGVGDSGGRVE